MVTYMADETKAPQIENPEKITAKDLAEMVKQMRQQPTTLPTKLHTGKVGNVGKLGTPG
jgi:hypothetical protein